MEDDPPQDEPDEFDGVFDNAPSIEQISEATKWPALQKSRPEDYAEEFPTASCRRRRSSKFAELLGVAMGVAWELSGCSLGDVWVLSGCCLGLGWVLAGWVLLVCCM